MADEVLKYIVTADPSQVLISFKQIEDGAAKAANATKAIGETAGQSLMKLMRPTKIENPLKAEFAAANHELNQLRATLKDLEPSPNLASGARTAGQEFLSLNRIAGGLIGLLTVRTAVRFFDDAIEASNALKASQLGLSAVAKNLNVDINAATTASRKLANDGFLTLTDSSKGLQNLLASGLNLKFATELMNKNKDAAIFNRQSHLGLSESIKVFTQGFKDELSSLTDATGVSTNYGRALNDTFRLVKTGQLDFSKYRDVLSDTEIATVKNVVAHTKASDQLDKTSKSVLAGVGFLRELELFSGNAAKGADSLQIEQAKLESKILLTKAAIGEGLTPAFKEFIHLANQLLDLLPKLGKGFADLFPKGTGNFLLGPIKATAEAAGWMATVMGGNEEARKARELQEQLESRWVKMIGSEGPERLEAIRNQGLTPAGLQVRLAADLFKAEQAARAAFAIDFPHAPATVRPPEPRKAARVLSLEEMKKISNARRVIDEEISSLNRKALDGLSAQFAAIDQQLRKILSSEFITTDQKGRAVLSAGGAKAAALHEFVAKAQRDAFKLDPQDDIDKLLSIQSKDFLETLKNDEAVRVELAKLGAETRVALAMDETARKAAEFQKEFNAYQDTEFFKTKTAADQVALRMAFIDRYDAVETAASNKRRQSLQDELDIALAATAGRNKHESQIFELLAKQQKERRGVTGPDLEILKSKQLADQLHLVQNQYDEVFGKIKTQAEGVFDAIFLKGKKGFAGLLDYIKGVFVVGIKDAFGSLVARLFAGPRPGGARSEGGLLGAFSSLFGGNRGGGFNLANYAGAGAGAGGTASLAGMAPIITKDAFGNYGLSSGGGLVQGAPAGTGAQALPFGGLGLQASTIGRFLSGNMSGTAGTVGALTAGIGGGFLGGFGTGKLLGIGGKRSAIAGGVGAAAGGIATAFFGPLVGALVGAGAGALTAGLLRIFGGQTREIKFAKEIERDFGLLIKDGKILKQIKGLGEAAFGKDADRRRFETLRLDSVQSMLMSYATASGQDPSRLPIYQRFFGKRGVADNERINIAKMAMGGAGVVTQPTLFLAGEAGPEAYAFQPQDGQSVLGGVSITYAPQVVVHGAGSPQENARQMAAVLEQHGRELVRQVTKTVGRDIGRTQFRQALFGV